jgi:hypothetical protein
MKCSVCSNKIKENYCSNCGQYFKDERISTKSILADLFGNIFSLEKSFFKNIRTGLLEPKILIQNYWNGFRRYYYSPSKFLVIASIFFLLQIMLSYDFLGAVTTSKVAQQFSLLIFLISFFSLSSFIVYIKYKKSFYEHLILNVYNVSIWSIIFTPISIALNLINTSKPVKFYFFYLYLILIITWNSKAFNMNKTKRSIYIIINCILVIVMLYGLVLVKVINI